MPGPFRILWPAAMLALAGGMLAAPVHASVGRQPLTSIVLRGIDRSGATHPVLGAIAVRLGRRGYENQYTPDAAGVLHVPAGTYVVGLSIPTVVAGVSDSFTLAARVVRAAGTTKTVTVDARQGHLVNVSLAVPGASPANASAALCTPAGPEPGDSPVDITAAGAGSGQRLYAIPYHATPLQFAYAATWQGADGSQYLLGGATAGIPARPRFSFRTADLATLTLRADSGASEGSSGYLSMAAADSACVPVTSAGIGPGLLPVPGQVTRHISAGRWWANFAPNDSNDDTTSMITTIAAGHAYTRAFGSAVRGPGQSTLPHIEAALRRGYFWFGLGGLYQDPAANGAECCADGIVRLSSGGRVLKTDRFKGGNGQYFTAILHKPGWYGVEVTARRELPRSGVSAATLSSKVQLTWRFAATARELSTTFVGAPVSITTFDPRGLDLNNNAAPGSVTPVHLTVWLGRSSPKFRVASVRLQVSYDNGGSWHSVPVTGRAGNWHADVHAPSSGFVSLRSIVTDIKGDRTVETIYRAYGVS